ncbi:hypothetical protein FACS1894205_2570 [Alphaproteobacteria bacterium]|nr:hypothetical protein FACS1894205_2570 [Alphaproteobacteria bacterium]
MAVENMMPETAPPSDVTRVAPPAKGEAAVTIPVMPAASYQIDAPSVTLRQEGSNLVATTPDGGDVVLQDYFLFTQSDLPPQISLNDGKPVEPGAIQAAIDNLGAIETAAGGGGGAGAGAAGGAAFSPYGPGGIGDGLNTLGLLGDLDMGFYVPEIDAAGASDPGTGALPPVTVTLNVLGLDGDFVLEGEKVTITATVDRAPQTDLVLTLSNGETITIKAGELSGSTAPFDSRPDELYIQGAQDFSISIIGSVGGGYESALDTSATASYTVIDDEDVTTVKLTATPSVHEDDDHGDNSTITYTVTLSDADGTLVTALAGHDVTVTLSNGDTVTIPAGSSSFSWDVAIDDPDVYKEADGRSLSITNAEQADPNGVGALEALAFDPAPAETTIADTIDTTTVKLTATSSVYEDDDHGDNSTITYTVTLRDADGNLVLAGHDVTVTLSDGAPVTILAGSSSFSWTVAIDDPDVYKEADSRSLSITNAEQADPNGVGALEALAFDPAPAETTIADTIDTTTVKLTATPSVYEDDDHGDNSTITYTVTLRDADGNLVLAGHDVTVTLSDNGAPVTIPAGSSSFSWTVAIDDPDVYKEADGRSLSITNAVQADPNGVGALEALAFDPAPAETIIADTVDTTTVGLTIIDVGGQFEVTVTIAGGQDHAAPPGGVTFILTGGLEVFVAEGATTGSSTFTAFEVGYSAGSDLTLAITGVEGYDDANNNKAIDYGESSPGFYETLDFSTATASFNPTPTVTVILTDAYVHEAALIRRGLGASHEGTGQDWLQASNTDANAHNVDKVASGTITVEGGSSANVVTVTVAGQNFVLGSNTLGQSLNVLEPGITPAHTIGAIEFTDQGNGVFGFTFTLTDDLAHSSAQGGHSAAGYLKDLGISAKVVNGGFESVSGSASQGVIHVVDDELVITSETDAASIAPPTSGSSGGFTSGEKVVFWNDSKGDANDRHPEPAAGIVGESSFSLDGVTFSVGRVDFTNNADSRAPITKDNFGSGGIANLVTSGNLGTFAYAHDTQGNPAKVYNDRYGLGITSTNDLSTSPSEIGYKSGQSEAVIMSLGGQVANAISLDLRAFYIDTGNYTETLTAVFYKTINGVETIVDVKNLSGNSGYDTNNASSGNLNGKFTFSNPAGFDKVVLFARDDTGGPNDNSDFYLQSVTFDALVLSQAGSFDAHGADGVVVHLGIPADVAAALVSAGIALTKDGDFYSARYTGGDDAGKLAFTLALDQDTGTWDFLQYRDINLAAGSSLRFDLIATDGDGDTQTIPVYPQYFADDFDVAQEGPLHGGDGVALLSESDFNELGGLIGTDGDDVFDASALIGGNHSFTGGAGDDTFIAGAGNDKFVYSSVDDGHDTIWNFDVEHDSINLDALFAAFGAVGAERPDDFHYTVEQQNWDAHDYTITVVGGGNTVEIDVRHSNTTDIETFKSAITATIEPDSQMGA